MNQPPPQIILFGDSLIEQSFSPERTGFGAALANTYVRRADILNRGLSGYNSPWLLEYLDTILSAYTSVNVILWIIMVGANDACLPGSLQHVPILKFKENVIQMIGLIQSNHASSRVLIISPPPINPKQLVLRGPRGGEDRDINVTKSYAHAVAEVVEQNYSHIGEVGFLDFHKILSQEFDENSVSFDESGPIKDYLTDGLHLGPKGYPVLYNAIMKFMRSEWPDIAPESLPMTAPWWGDFAKNKKSVQNRDEL